MCGIAGVFSVNEVLDKVPLVKELLKVQHHRGPDATGVMKVARGVLGHNRLSIIDLSSAANQPFVYQYLTIVYNGEVYNYIEIKAELIDLGYFFETNSDTEVVCAAYKEWGAECVKRFVGMWAFAIWDEDEQCFFCSRDRFGIKPFHYTIMNGDFYFASELKTLLEIPGVDKTLNEKQMARGMNLGIVSYKDETYYTSIHQLRGSFNLLWKNGDIKVNRYWDLEKVEIPEKEDEAIAKFKDLFNESLRIHMRSDVPVGSCLSGGLDSSSIVASIAARHSDVPYKTFTIYYTAEGATDERPFARELSKKYRSILPFEYEPSDLDIEENFERFLASVECPPAGSSYYSQYFVMQLAEKNNVKVLLNGQGSDEFLVGYLHSYIRVFADYLRRLQLGKFLNSLYHLRKVHSVSLVEIVRKIALSFLLLFWDENKFAHFEFRNKFKRMPELDYGAGAVHLENKYSGRLDNFLYHLIMTTTLPTLLHFEDRNSMKFSLESRVPFLDHRLVEYGFSLPLKWRLKNGLTKNVLREAMKDVLPEEIYARKDKKGFVTPGEKRWVAGPLRNYFDFKSKNSMLNWRLNVLSIWKNRK